MTAFGQSVNTQVESRRASLEAYIACVSPRCPLVFYCEFVDRSAVESVLLANGKQDMEPTNDDADKALQLTAEFLDPDMHKLVLVKR